jgi:hypothetical protein
MFMRNQTISSGDNVVRRHISRETLYREYGPENKEIGKINFRRDAPRRAEMFLFGKWSCTVSIAIRGYVTFIQGLSRGVQPFTATDAKLTHAARLSSKGWGTPIVIFEGQKRAADSLGRACYKGSRPNRKIETQ